jgi:hypothetical protein
VIQDRARVMTAGKTVRVREVAVGEQVIQVLREHRVVSPAHHSIHRNSYPARLLFRTKYRMAYNVSSVVQNYKDSFSSGIMVK